MSDELHLSLDSIGVEEGTDKSSAIHDYLSSYESLFERWRDKPITLMEIGGRDPSSARTWSRYFSSATILIVDREPSHELLGIDRVVPVKIESWTMADLSAALGDARPSIIIDDGTHRLSDQTVAINALFPALEGDGVYIVEDLHTSFGSLRPKYGDRGVSTFDELLKLAGFVTGATFEYGTTDRFSRAILDSVGSIEFQQKTAVLRKKLNSGKAYSRKHVSEFRDASNVTIANFTPYARLRANLLDAPERISRLLDGLVGEGVVEFPAAHSATVRNGRVTFGGIVTDEYGDIASESLNCVQNLQETPRFFQVAGGQRWLSKRYDAPTVHYGKVEGRRHVLLKSAWDANYGHWLYDSLARLSLLDARHTEERPLLVVDAHNGPIGRVIRDSLRILGYQDDDVLLHDFRKDAVFEELHVPGLVSRHPAHKAPEATEFLARMNRGVEGSGIERLYLSRNSYGRRHLRNEDEIWSIFEKCGFRRVATESMSLEEQIATFADAKVVAGNLGAAFSSLAFCPQGVRVLALATEAMPHDFFYDIACHKGGVYVGVQGLAEEGTPDMSSNFSVNRASVVTALDALL
ncbi:glycosyltransferase family 61 protein [Brachybacterium sp. J144]|uniref:glycosyltransferase family 61 protein n=1 Tax=Brachybacterium sp. J144 TaxID=3116487 RepID=UPI002E762CFB|nr:glycosyltransferase family 61 protein [Brachybacterium sp. J144]MEE1650724.1 glycosyltransferase family 61 protein [Brachybacterium sp. J144]